MSTGIVPVERELRALPARSSPVWRATLRTAPPFGPRHVASRHPPLDRHQYICYRSSFGMPTMCFGDIRASSLGLLSHTVVPRNTGDRLCASKRQGSLVAQRGCMRCDSFSLNVCFLLARGQSGQREISRSEALQTGTMQLLLLRVQMADAEGEVLLPPVDLDKSYDIERTFSASDLPAFEGLFSDCMAPSCELLPRRASPPVESSASPPMVQRPSEFQVLKKMFIAHVSPVTTGLCF